MQVISVGSVQQESFVALTTLAWIYMVVTIFNYSNSFFCFANVMNLRAEMQQFDVAAYECFSVIVTNISTNFELTSCR